MAVSSRDRVGARSDRRAVLLAAAAALVGSSGLDDLDATAVAQKAGVSKALVYYYFPTHRDLQVAVVRAAADEFLESLQATDPSLPPADQLAAGLETAIAFIELHPVSYTALARGAGCHPALSAVFEHARDAVADLLAERAGLTPLSPGRRIALRSWIALVEEAVLHWMVADRPVPRYELVSYCQEVGLHILTTALARPDRSSRVRRVADTR
jgi:AcrR family transcriptional regulator